MKPWKILTALLNLISGICASTHWLVTENGRIQTNLNSPFHLRRPYDLITLLEQEIRRSDISNVHNDLLKRKNQIDSKWSNIESAQDMETRIYEQDVNCFKAGRLLSNVNDMFVGLGANGSNRVKFNFEESEDNPASSEPSQPDCSKYSSLDFSIFAYEHLKSMIERKDLKVKPNLNLDYLLPVPSLETFGRGIVSGLLKNNTSWLHYNLGILYWRMQGDAIQAIECARRALHFAPKEFKDIPLLNLAWLLHQAYYSEDAAILLQAAIDHAPNQPINYLALGNVLAVLSDYNRSIACYDKALELQPDLDDVILAKHASLCFKNLDSGLMELHENLMGILTDLHEYHSKQQQWVRLQERYVWEQVPLETQLEAHIFSVAHKAEKLNSMLTTNYGQGQRCVQSDADATISCDFVGKEVVSNFFEVTSSLQKLLLNVESETQRIGEQVVRTEQYLQATKEASKIALKIAQMTNIDKPKKIDVVTNSEEMPRVLHEAYPTSLPTSSDLYFDSDKWPEKDECVNWNLNLIENDDLNIPVFLPPENKGFQITKMLTDFIDLPSNAEHNLPWYPPVCEKPSSESEKLLRIPDFLYSSNAILKSHPILKRHFLNYVNNGKSEESEIGQRIVTAMKKKTGPSWILATVASLYWRIRSNTKNAIQCLEFAFQHSPNDYTDVVLVSIASFLHQLNLIDDAITTATLAFKINYNEPSTNFLLALLHYQNGNPILAMYYMKNVLRVNSGYYDNLAEKLLKTWACRIKMGLYKDGVEDGKIHNVGTKALEGMCSKKDVNYKGEGVVCSSNGEQCKTASIQCFRTDNDGKKRRVETGGGTISLDTSKLFPKQCNKYKIVNSVVSPLLKKEISREGKLDQSKAENLIETTQQTIHMRISLGNDKSTGMSDFYEFTVSMSLSNEADPETVLHVYDKSGTYSLSPSGCKRIQDSDWLLFTSMWQSMAARNFDIGPYLKPLTKKYRDGIHVQPWCSDTFQTSLATLDQLISSLLKHDLYNTPDNRLFEWLSLMAGDHQSSLPDLVSKITLAYRENTTSWILATAASFYWRGVGKTNAAITCIRQALDYVPNEMRDIPLLSLANLLHFVGVNKEALEIAYVALESNPKFAVNHFTVGNIHASMGQLESAISYFRSSLNLDSGFEPARNRLQALLCKLLLDDEDGPFRNIKFLH